MKYSTKLTKEQITAIRTRASSGEPLPKIAQSYGTYPQRLRHYVKDITKPLGPIWSNDWKLAGDHWEVTISRLSEIRGVMLIDDEDKALIEQRVWRLSPGGRAVATFNNKPMELHRYLCPAPRSLWVSFIDRNRLNYRRENMRHVTPTECILNQGTTDRGAHRRRSQQGMGRYVPGVGKWDAYIDTAYLGRYPDEATAKKATEAARWWFDKYPLPRGEELLKVYAARDGK